MTLNRPDHEWPGLDDKLVVDDMLRSRDSPHWRHCLDFMQGLVQMSGLPVDAQDDVIQNAMTAVLKYLPDFRYKGRLRNWLAVIVHRHGINEYRRRKLDKQWLIRPNDQTETSEDVISHIDREVSNSPPTPEQLYLKRERWDEIFLALQHYLDSHQNTDLRRVVLWQVLFEGASHKEVARRVGISPEMVGYFVRAALRCVRDQLKR